MKLGARVLKTGVAIVFALFIAELLNVPSPVFAGIAAIFAIQPSIYRSYLTIVEQIQGNLIGAIIAVIFGLLFGHHIVAIGIAAIIVIGIMMKLKLEKAITLAIVTLIVIMEFQGDEFMTFALIRFSTIMIGVFAAFIVNLVFIPPKYEVKLFRAIYTLQDDIIRWTRLAVRQASEHTSTKTALRKIKNRMDNIDTMYGLYREERRYLRKNRMAKSRKLVIYRQMLTTTKKSYELLQRLHKHENELVKLPETIQVLIQERLDGLLTYHEQLLLKYTGKLKPEHSNWHATEQYMHGNEVMDLFIDYISSKKLDDSFEELTSYHLLYILSRILDYEENLEHLDTLIVSYRNYHSKETNIDLEQEFY
jgi:uncharacterized membrane protein YgaE (UPF0421/DUF939 family)